MTPNSLQAEALATPFFGKEALESEVPAFGIHNRRFLGNKYKLLTFIESVINAQVGKFSSICDIFAGTGAVGAHFNAPNVKVISNDILASSHVSLKAFLSTTKINQKLLADQIDHLNAMPALGNYFSRHFGGTYFTNENAKKIGTIREEIDVIAPGKHRDLLLASLLYATDKVANTVGHYDAYRKKIDMHMPVRLRIPNIATTQNPTNQIYRKDANQLVREIECDVLYLDPPYNSRQYSDCYHLLENLVEWKQPKLFGKAKKMDRTGLKSAYCRREAKDALADLIEKAQTKHILLSYNNTGDSKDGRSNARISDDEITKMLKRRGKVRIFEQTYRAFTTGRSGTQGHTERLFYCKVM